MGLALAEAAAAAAAAATAAPLMSWRDAEGEYRMRVLRLSMSE